jgi:2,3-bisphosphoglycerate-dependent phosphoglycerate mutase
VVSVEIVFETHSITEDNENGVATGWLPGRLSERGRGLARELGGRRRRDGLAAVITSDLRRAIETSDIAFEDASLPVFRDWRLRECNYGRLNGTAAALVHSDRRRHLDAPYPGGESWGEAVNRVESSLIDVRTLFDGQRVLVIGHMATRWALERLVNERTLAELATEEFRWQAGWRYVLGD